MSILGEFGRIKNKILKFEHTTGQPGAVQVPPNIYFEWDFPPYWREEANSREEYLIRYGRAVGLFIVISPDTEIMTVRRTVDEADEARITWPGKKAT